MNQKKLILKMVLACFYFDDIMTLRDIDSGNILLDKKTIYKHFNL